MGMAAYGERGVTMFDARTHHTSGKLRTGLVVGVAAVVSMFAATGAQAQNCIINSPTQLGQQLGIIGASPASVSSMITSSLTAANTAFLLQSTAFVGAPGNPAPDQQGGGVWGRAVGGEVDIKSSTATTASQTVPAGTSASINCSQKVDTTFVGAQLGADIARLNVNGWNLHFGTTVGYLETRGRLVEGATQLTDPFTGALQGGGPFTSSTQVPFAGVYAAATYGGFFIDGLLRAEYYQTKLNAPGDFLFNQEIDAHGWSFSASTGYNWKPNNSNWFVEPSAGVVISRTKVDPFNYSTSGTAGNTTFSETLRIDDVKSDIGRVGIRVGTTYESSGFVWAPFVAASVWHEFGPNATANAATCPGLAPGQSCAFVGAAATMLTSSSSTSTFGTFGQYSVGVSGQLVGTGWLGFLRADYRDGNNLHGVSGTGGIRYQFTPEGVVAPKMPVKAPAYKAPIVEAVNWTGFYIGGFGSAELGTADWNYITGSAQPHIGGYDVGGNVGYNWQNGRVVVGVEGALEKTNLNGGTACGPLVAGTTAFGPGSTNGSPMFQMTCNAWANWIAEATARIGFTWDRALFYVKGGGAWTNEHFSATCNLGPLQVANPVGQQCVNPARVNLNGATISADINRGGWIVGWGTEFALTRNWSAKAETSYLSFGDKDVIASDGSALNLGIHIWETKIGVNYRFDGGPIVARY